MPNWMAAMTSASPSLAPPTNAVSETEFTQSVEAQIEGFADIADIVDPAAIAAADELNVAGLAASEPVTLTGIFTGNTFFPPAPAQPGEYYIQPNTIYGNTITWASSPAASPDPRDVRMDKLVEVVEKLVEACGSLHDRVAALERKGRRAIDLQGETL
jgi:hypothetical protein